MATKRRKRYLENAGGYDTINSRYGSGDFYRPVVGPNLPELVVTPYGKISYASTNGDFGTRFLTRDEWLNKNSKTATSSSVTNLDFQEPSQAVKARMRDAYEIINGARNQLIENNRPVYKVGGAKRSIRNAGRYINVVPMDNTRVVMPFIDPNPPIVEQFVPTPYSQIVGRPYTQNDYIDSVALRRLQELKFMQQHPRRYKPYQIKDKEKQYKNAVITQSGFRYF